MTEKHDHGDIRHVQADGAVLFRGPNLRVRVAVLKPGVVLLSAHGEVVEQKDVNVETAMLLELEAELERAKSLMVFADLRQSPRVPAASRENISQWLRRHRARLLPSHVLAQSKMLEMAMSIISMLSGSGLFEIHTRPVKFLTLVKRVAPELTELPEVPAR